METSMALGGAARRNKGASFEREIAIRLREIDNTARRNVEECQQASTDIKTSLPFALQLKCLGRWSTTPHKIWEQARDGDRDKTPVGIVKVNHKETLVIMSFDGWFDMVKKVYGKVQDSDSSGSSGSRSSLPAAPATVLKIKP